MLRNSLLASTAVLGLALAAPAQAVIAPFGGTFAAGVDPLGHFYFSDSGSPSWGSPGLGFGEETFNQGGLVGSGTVPWSNQFSFTFNIGAGGIINPGTTLGGFTLETRFNNVTDGVAWTPTIIGNQVIFNAPGGNRLDPGEAFFVNVVFSSIDEASFSWGAAWEEKLAVPVPASLALFGAGLLGLGLVGARRRKAA